MKSHCLHLGATALGQWILSSCHIASHCHNVWPLSASVATDNNIMYRELTSCLCLPGKLHRKARWHCPSPLITAEIKTLSQWERKSLSGGGMGGWGFFCVFMSIIRRCGGSVACENLSSSWQLIIHLHFSVITRPEEKLINYPHLSLWYPTHHETELTSRLSRAQLSRPTKLEISDIKCTFFFFLSRYILSKKVG